MHNTCYEGTKSKHLPVHHQQAGWFQNWTQKLYHFYENFLKYVFVYLEVRLVFLTKKKIYFTSFHFLIENILFSHTLYPNYSFSTPCSSKLPSTSASPDKLLSSHSLEKNRLLEYNNQTGQNKNITRQNKSYHIEARHGNATQGK